MPVDVESAAATPLHPKPPRILACVHCQYRKIKCDRQQPCANCIKAKVVCKASTPTPSHHRRRPHQHLLERLSRCEQLLKQYTENSIQTQREPAHVTADPTEICNSSSTTPSKDQPGATVTESRHASTLPGKVVQENGNVRFMDNCVRIGFYEELAALRSIIDKEGSQEYDSSTFDISPDTNAEVFLGAEDTPVDIQELHPNFTDVFQLWQLFKVRVNPLTKVVHIPSLQPYIMDAAMNINQVPLAYQALLFSIYTIAVTSLTNEESVQFLGMNRDDALNQFTRGTKLALTRADFMRKYNMTILQALLFYMLSLNGRTDNNSIWIMGGTIMRIAQKMGYHRDGENFNLSPFETEMRRRIWWQLITQDSRYTMVVGLSQSWVHANWDTKLPQHINDEDLSPDSMSPLIPRDGPTEMVFVLILYHYQAFNLRSHRQFEAAVTALRSGGDRGPIVTYRALLDEINQELTEFEQKYVDLAAGDVHIAATVIRHLNIDKIENVMLPMEEQPEWGTEILDEVDSVFKGFVENHFKVLPALKKLSHTGLMWFVRVSQQMDVFLLFTAKLYKRPIGKLTDKAWTAIESIYEVNSELFDLSREIMYRQAIVTLKSWAVREQALAQRGQHVEVPGFIVRLRQLARPSPRTTPQQISSYQQTLLDLNQCLGGDANAANFNLDMWGNLSMHQDAPAQQVVPPPPPHQQPQTASTTNYSMLEFSKLDFSKLDLARLDFSTIDFTGMELGE